MSQQPSSKPVTPEQRAALSRDAQRQVDEATLRQRIEERQRVERHKAKQG